MATSVYCPGFQRLSPIPQRLQVRGHGGLPSGPSQAWPIRDCSPGKKGELLQHSGARLASEQRLTEETVTEFGVSAVCQTLSQKTAVVTKSCCSSELQCSLRSLITPRPDLDRVRRHDMFDGIWMGSGEMGAVPAFGHLWAFTFVLGLFFALFTAVLLRGLRRNGTDGFSPNDWTDL